MSRILSPFANGPVAAVDTFISTCTASLRNREPAVSRSEGKSEGGETTSIEKVACNESSSRPAFLVSMVEREVSHCPFVSLPASASLPSVTLELPKTGSSAMSLSVLESCR